MAVSWARPAFRRPDSWWRRSSLQQPRQAAVLQHPPTRLLLRAVTHHVVLEVDRLDAGAAARALLAGPAMDLEWHRHLVGDRVADQVLVVVEGGAEHLVARRVEGFDLVGVEVRSPLEGRQARGPEELVDP